MNKLLFSAVIAFSIAIISPAFAANWSGPVNAAINSGHFDQIDVIAAKNPGDAGAIAEYVLQQAGNTGNPGKSIKLLEAATPLSGQIPDGNVGGLIGALNALLKLANDPGFQKSNPKGASKIFADLLNISGQQNFGNADPHFHDKVLVDAQGFLKGNPDNDDDDPSLAQINDFLHGHQDLLHKQTQPVSGPSPE